MQCRRTLRRKNTHSTEGMGLFPRPLRVSLLCKAFNRDNFPKTRSAKKNPCSQLHFMANSTSILSLVFADEAANGACKVRVVVDRPRLCRHDRASSVDANVNGLKNSYTQQRIAKATFFSFDAPSSRTLKLIKSFPSLFSSSMPPPESGSPLILIGFWGFNRRVMQLASRGECDRVRAGSSFVDFEGSLFFLVFSEKATRAGDEKQRK